MPKTQTFAVKKHLEVWLRQKCYTKYFPAHPGNGYVTNYTELAAYLNKNVHPEVARGALLAQIGNGDIIYEDALYLNNHGPGHVKCVIEKASDLLRELNLELSPYEGFLLLVAIHFHDVGIVFGRKEHEDRISSVMTSPEVAKRMGDDIEARTIRRIASAHGGRVDNGSRDTISNLVENEELFGQTIRQRFLAALLRIADELADDRTRASRFGLKGNSIPKFSHLFHAYSYALQSVRVDKQTVRLSYEITPETGTRTYAKAITDADGQRQDLPVFLLDEIYVRIRKMHQERMYCMRFWPSQHRQVLKIKAKVIVCLVPTNNKSFIPEEKITFTLQEEGYPTGPTDNSNCTLCLGPEYYGLPDGENIKKTIKKATKKTIKKTTAGFEEQNDG